MENQGSALRNYRVESLRLENKADHSGKDCAVADAKQPRIFEGQRFQSQGSLRQCLSSFSGANMSSIGQALALQEAASSGANVSSIGQRI